jgi:hypothetical protein
MAIAAFGLWLPIAFSVLREAVKRVRAEQAGLDPAPQTASRSASAIVGTDQASIS